MKKLKLILLLPFAMGCGKHDATELRVIKIEMNTIEDHPGKYIATLTTCPFSSDIKYYTDSLYKVGEVIK